MAVIKDLFSAIDNSVKQFTKSVLPDIETYKPKQRADVRSSGYGYSRLLYTHSFNGQKNHGELGPIRSYLPDYYGLRARSWQAMLESEIAQIVIGKYLKWVVGKGLKLQAEPQKIVLESAGITVDQNKFTDSVESRFSVFCASKRSDYSGMRSLNTIASEVQKNAIIGGDIVCVLRYDNKKKTINLQTIDGAHLDSPLYGTETYAQILANGNRIENGIELSPKNEHIAYWVKRPGEVLAWDRIVCKDPVTKLTVAFLVYGLKYRLDNHRGIPLLSVVLESIKKLERYKEATVGSAEERQKVAFAIEHDLGSSGENPLTRGLAVALNGNSDDGSDDLPRTIEGEQLAEKVFASTNKQTFNLTPGAKMTSLDSDNELYFKDFYSVNIDLICAALQIPPNVALSKYDSNFSASRAALKDWEHSLIVSRNEFSEQFYKPIYAFWFHIQVLLNTIQAPGYLTAFDNDDWMITEAYLTARFIGANVPHIDPMKEVSAERLKLGATAVNIPLTTVEAAVEALSGGDSDSNMEQFAAELEESKKLGIKPEEPVIAPGIGGNTAE